ALKEFLIGSAIAFMLAAIIVLMKKIKLLQDELNYFSDKATHDSLTQLLNRCTISSFIDKYLYENGQAQCHTFLLLDVDDFKNINDERGHFAGDTALTNLAKAMVDVFGNDCCVGRVGGDEFVALLKDTDKCKAEIMIANLSKMLESSLTISIGMAFYNKDGKNFEELYQAADAAMYISKRRGKNTYTFYGE
ncbi:MAG: GGDEF domain-containing protein, partial [Oscillospiraceae bacterium]